MGTGCEYDHDELMDRCARCGSPAMFMWRSPGGTGAILSRPIVEWRSECSACAEETDWFDNRYSASHAWNRQQRKKKKETT